MTYQEARDYFGLKSNDKIDIKLTDKFLEERTKQFKYSSRSLREDIEKDIAALKVLLEYEKNKKDKLC